MPPALTEAWAAEYLEIIVTFLVFTLGIPALILQFAVPERLREVSRHRLKTLRWGTFAISAFIALGALAFVWVLHPCYSDALCAEQGIAGAMIITAIIVIVPVGFGWFIYAEYFTMETAIRDLQKRCEKSVRGHRIVAERILSDLVYLGEQGDPGREKSQVVKALDGLAAFVQGRPHYVGGGLEQLVQGIETTVVDGAKIGDTRNFIQVAWTLEGILHRLRMRGLSAAPDAAVVLSTLERLGVAAIRLDSERAAIAILEAVASATAGQDEAYQSASEGLFAIGASALTDGRHFLVAVAALSKLEALARRRTPLRGEVAADLLGLLAHLWTSGGTARRHARAVLERMAELFDPSLPDCIEAAIGHQYLTAKFDTADKLLMMLEEL